MTDEKTYTPEEEREFARQADAYLARVEADANRAILAVKTIHPAVKCTIIVRHEGGHAIVVSDDDAGEAIAALYKTYAKSQN